MTVLNTLYPLAEIAWKDGMTFSGFGPCHCGGSQTEPCRSCHKAQEIEAAGLDWEEEYQKWLKNRRQES